MTGVNKERNSTNYPTEAQQEEQKKQVQLKDTKGGRERETRALHEKCGEDKKGRPSRQPS